MGNVARPTFNPRRCRGANMTPTFMGRECADERVLREWRGGFTSFHELMCAVESSWVYPGEPSRPLAGNVTLPGVDDDVGPSDPEPPALAREGEVVVMRARPAEHGSGVSAVAFAEDGRVLYSGHEDGTVRKWDATAAELLWTSQAPPSLRVLPPPLAPPLIGPSPGQVMPKREEFPEHRAVLGLLPLDGRVYCWSRRNALIAISIATGRVQQHIKCEFPVEVAPRPRSPLTLGHPGGSFVGRHRGPPGESATRGELCGACGRPGHPAPPRGAALPWLPPIRRGRRRRG